MQRISCLGLSAAMLLGSLSPTRAAGAGEADPVASAAAPRVEEWTIPRDGPLLVNGSGRVKKGLYLRPPLGPDARSGVIVLDKQQNLTLDLREVVLQGAAPMTDQDQ